MKIIISPAKRMKEDPDSMPWRDLPCFLDKTRQILDTLLGMSSRERQKLWACNDQIAEQNDRRLERMDLKRSLTPAILSYQGIQYQRMAPEVFTEKQLEYVQEHLRILSGFYGILRPLDGVTPYRLEMQAKLRVGEASNLYEFWGDRLAAGLEETDWVLNLASKEYSTAVSRYLDPGVKLITCQFGEEKKGRVVEKGTICKMARGEMVRFMAERNLSELGELREFHGLGFRFAPEYSDENNLTFLRSPSSP